MKKILYYPYINLPRTEWTLRTLLYYDNVGSIVPHEYFYYPERNYEPFMLELIRNELVTPINPLEVINNPWQVTEPFLQFIEHNTRRIQQKRSSLKNGSIELIHGGKFLPTRIHSDKFEDHLFYQLKELGLAKRGEGQWWLVETKTANILMKFLVTLISAKTNRLPTTDKMTGFSYYSTKRNTTSKRITILNSLIPFPEDINLNKLKRFKEKHSDLLNSFRTQVEKIALDHKLIEGTALFDKHLEVLKQRKEELTAKMNESKFNSIIFGTVCGLIGASQGIAFASTTAAFVGALPGFANAVYAALQIERAENLFDQSGLKYIALVDKRLRK